MLWNGIHKELEGGEGHDKVGRGQLRGKRAKWAKTGSWMHLVGMAMDG